MKPSVINAGSYRVHVGEQSLAQLHALLAEGRYTSTFILCDDNTLRFCMPQLISHCPALAESPVIELESGEEAKSIEFCSYIWETLFECQADKRCLLINLGGGVVSDVGSFSASLYKRGIDFVNVPTSLLAMADASVGGKNGINFCGIKNSIGTINPPTAVYIYPGFLNTLPARHFVNGLAEVFKIALVSDPLLWDYLKQPITSSHLENLICKSVKLKNAVVIKDPFEKNIRKVLNFGHSIGHALESLLIDELLHGEAIAAGMIMESHIAWQKKLIGKKQLAEIAATLLAMFPAIDIDTLNIDDVETRIRNDKKTQGGKLLFALIDGIGSCRFDQAVSRLQLQCAIEYYKALVS